MKTSLPPDRQQMLCEYVEAVHNSGLNYETRGRYVDGVFFFLCNTDEVSRRGYRRFRKAHAGECVLTQDMTDAICDFLASRGAGFKTVRDGVYKAGSNSGIKRLEKREVRHKEAIDNFLFWLENEREYSKSTLSIYLTTLREYFSYFDDFGLDNCRKYIAQLGNSGLSPKTIRIRITCLERYGVFVKKPIKLKRPKVAVTFSTENIPSEKEYAKLLEYLDGHDPRWAFIIRLFATTGARISEMHQFTYEHIQKGVVVLKGKGSKYRQFFFIKPMQQMAKGKSGWVCVGRGGHRLTTRGINYHLKKIGSAAGIPREKMHAHAFRHFFAKMYLKKTKDVVGLADLLGHESVDTTRIYLQKSQEEQIRSFNRTITW